MIDATCGLENHHLQIIKEKDEQITVEEVLHKLKYTYINRHGKSFLFPPSYLNEIGDFAVIGMLSELFQTIQNLCSGDSQLRNWRISDPRVTVNFMGGARIMDCLMHLDKILK